MCACICLNFNGLVCGATFGWHIVKFQTENAQVNTKTRKVSMSNRKISEQIISWRGCIKIYINKHVYFMNVYDCICERYFGFMWREDANLVWNNVVTVNDKRYKRKIMENPLIDVNISCVCVNCGSWNEMLREKLKLLSVQFEEFEPCHVCGFFNNFCDSVLRFSGFFYIDNFVEIYYPTPNCVT